MTEAGVVISASVTVNLGSFLGEGLLSEGKLLLVMVDLNFGLGIYDVNSASEN
jgi:hypothetical protein